MLKAPKIKWETKLTGHAGSVYSLIEKYGTESILSGGGDGKIIEWDPANPEVAKLLAQTDSQIFSIEYIPEKDLLIAGNMNGGIHWIDLKRKKDLINIAHHKGGVFGLHHLEGYLYALGGEGKISRWDIDSCRPVETLHLSGESLRCLKYNPEAGELAIGSSDHSVYFLDLETLQIKRRIERAHEGSVFSLCYLNDGRHLLTGGRDAQLRLWDLRGPIRMLKEIPAHLFTVNDILTDPQNRWIISASRDKTIKIWDSESLELIKVIDAVRSGGHVNSVNRIIWPRGINKLISASDDRNIIVWAVKNPV